jgi:carnitine 3-dehydrogenase
MQLVGADEAYIARGNSFFTVESHMRHLGEAHAGDRLRVTTQLLDATGKRMHLYSRMFDASGNVVATVEHMLVHVSLETRRATPPEPALRQCLADIQNQHAALPRPERLHCGHRDAVA